MPVLCPSTFQEFYLSWQKIRFKIMPDTSSIVLSVLPSSHPLFIYFNKVAGGRDMLGTFTLDFLIPLEYCGHLHVSSTLNNKKHASFCEERQ